jgi:hypothetical protein
LALGLNSDNHVTSEEVGAPLSNESEEEFVARAKKSFKKILMTKMASK